MRHFFNAASELVEGYTRITTETIETIVSAVGHVVSGLESALPEYRESKLPVAIRECRNFFREGSLELVDGRLKAMDKRLSKLKVAYLEATFGGEEEKKKEEKKEEKNGEEKSKGYEW